MSERWNPSKGNIKKNEKKIVVTSKTEQNLFNRNFFQNIAVPMIIIILYIRIFQTMFVTAILAKFCAISLRAYKPSVLSIFYINAQIRTCTYDAIHSHEHKHTRTHTEYSIKGRSFVLFVHISINLQVGMFFIFFPRF